MKKIVKMKNSRKLQAAMAAALLAGGGSAMAQQAGDWVLGAGWMHFAPQDSSKPLTVTSPVNSTVPGSGANVQSSDTLGLSATYFLDSHWGIEGVLGVPPKFKLDGEGSLGAIGELGNARQWSPTILGKYYFNDGESAFRPFVGLGATYVWYSDVKLTPNLQSALASQFHQSPFAVNTTAKLDSKFAPVLNIGAAYQFDKHWGISFSVSYIPLKTKAKLTTNSVFGLPVATSEASLKLNPIVTYVAATYRF